MKKYKILLSGYYGYRNVGDDLLLATLLKILQKCPIDQVNIPINSKSSILVDTTLPYNLIEPEDTERNKLFRILAHIRREISLLKQNDVMIYGGGTRLFETKARGYSSLLVKYVVLKFNSIFLKRKIIHLGVGIGDVYSKLGIWLLQQILNLSTFILVRDERSYTTGYNLMSSTARISLGADLIFANKELDFFEKRETNDDDIIRVGLSFFQYYDYISKDNNQASLFFENVCKLISELLRSDANIEIYLFSFQKGKGGDDSSFNTQIIEKMKNERIKHVDYTIKTNMILDKLRLMDFCIGMRYHFCLLALFYRIPTIGINYQPKLASEFASLEIPQYCVDMNHIDRIFPLYQSIVKEKEWLLKYSAPFKIINERKRELTHTLESILLRYLNSDEDNFGL